MVNESTIHNFQLFLPTYPAHKPLQLFTIHHPPSTIHHHDPPTLCRCTKPTEYFHSHMQITHHCSLLLPVGRGDGRFFIEQEEELSCLVVVHGSRLQHGEQAMSMSTFGAMLLISSLGTWNMLAGLKPKLVQLLEECY